jgi:hydrogenase expression/formation protein HypD
MIREVFEVVPRAWRGIGTIPRSGFGLRPAYADLEAERRFQVGQVGGHEAPECKSGLVLQGLLRPPDCPEFGKKCTPEMPLGATMVSSEGACAAYYRYRRFGTSCPASTSP